MTLSKEGEVLVVGAGAMGAGIAQVAAAAGHRVRLYDLREGAAETAIAQIAASLTKLVDKARMTPETRDALLANLAPIAALTDLSEVVLVVEAVKEDLAVKQALFAELESMISDTAILATNTSSISVTAIGSALKRPERFAGLHFFNPAPVMPLVEVVAGLATDPAVVDTLMRTALAWGKTPVAAKSMPAFIVNRVARAYYAEALRVLQEGGCDAATLDAIMREGAGFRMGPFELMDLIGHDISLAVTTSVHAAYFGDQRFTPSLIQQEMVAAGRLGRKTGRGFFDYSQGAAPPSPASHAPAAAPTEALIQGDLGPAEPLAKRMEAAGIIVRREPGDGRIVVAGATLALTDGRLATVRAAEEQALNLVLFDLSLDWAAVRRIALTRADQAAPSAVAAAAGLFQALGMTVSVMDDVPGMIAARTICMLANEATEALNQRLASAADIDLAMIKGLNYPGGPLAWADRLTPGWVLGVLENLTGAYGEDRYRASIRLRRAAAAGGRFREAAA